VAPALRGTHAGVVPVHAGKLPVFCAVWCVVFGASGSCRKLR
jgi:hypothetical protein